MKEIIENLTIGIVVIVLGFYGFFYEPTKSAGEFLFAVLGFAFVIKIIYDTLKND